MALTINKKYMTENDCYKAGRKITPTGIMWHSTAGKEGEGVGSDYYFNRWNKSGITKCVHAFLDETDVTEMLPTEKGNCHRAWHAGGAMNNTHIGFEIIEPKSYSDSAYFEKAYENAIQYTVILCQRFGITTITEKNLLCHSEGYIKYKEASNHADVMHWFKYHNKTMDDVRAEVQKRLNGSTSSSTSNTSTTSSTTSSTTTTSLPSLKTVVKALQTALNTDYKCGLVVDGVYGTKSKAAIKTNNISSKAKTQSVKWLQSRMNELGYVGSDKKVLTVDGKFGNNTLYAVKQFQTKNKLTVDGIVGTGSMDKILSYYK